MITKITIIMILLIIFPRKKTNNNLIIKINYDSLKSIDGATNHEIIENF